MKRISAWILTSVLALAAAAPELAQAQAIPVVKLSAGEINGVQKGQVEAFLGIPYAAPPVGPLRWAPPAPVAAWSGARDATQFSASCPQVLNPPAGRPPWTSEYMIPGPMSEDCLYLNVWRPASATSAKLPVLVWFHGGAMVEGSGSVPVYDGAAMAARGVIVVNLNYRLGVLGFLAHPELSREQGGTSGDYALMDMVAALRWVHDNIAAFGGDPARVTIAGQSAGAGAVNMLTASPEAKGLFWRTITESGSGWSGHSMVVSQDDADAEGARFAARIGASSLADLRALPADTVVQDAAAFTAASQTRFGTVRNARLLPDDPSLTQFRPGFNDTPVLSGFNWDEQSGMDPKFGQWTPAEFFALRDAAYGPVAAQAAAIYPASTDAEAQAAGEAMDRDRSRGSVYEWAKRRATAGRQPIYIYFFHHPEPGPTQARYGTFHSSEIPYVFGNLNAPRPFDDADHRVSNEMMTRWVSFIKGGTPDSPGLAAWPRFNPANPQIMLLGDHEGTEPVLSPDKRRLNDALIDKTETSPSKP